MAAMQPMTIPAMAPPEMSLLEVPGMACGVEEVFVVVVVGCVVVVAGLSQSISVGTLTRRIERITHLMMQLKMKRR